LLLDAERALVLWLEHGAEAGEVMARVIARDGRMGEPASLARTLAQRTSGFPRMGRYDGGVLVAWTEPGESSRVRAATLDLNGEGSVHATCDAASEGLPDMAAGDNEPVGRRPGGAERDIELPGIGLREIELREIRLPLREPFRISSGSVTDRRIL